MKAAEQPECPYCKGEETRAFLRLAEGLMEYICEACGCTFNVAEEE